MSEPLTPRKQRILEVLDEAEGALETADVNWRAFRVRTRKSLVERELFDLERRGLAEPTETVGGTAWFITEAGGAAL